MIEPAPTALFQDLINDRLTAQRARMDTLSMALADGYRDRSELAQRISDLSRRVTVLEARLAQILGSSQDACSLCVEPCQFCAQMPPRAPAQS